MDTLGIASFVASVGALLVAAVVAVVVGRRRGIDQVEAQADSEVKRLVEAQAARLALQDRQIAELTAQVAALQVQVATLKTDLDVERRISLRFRDAATADGK